MNSKLFPSLTSVNPEVSPGELLADFIPPREFSEARFENYIPHREFASQTDALNAAREFIVGRKAKIFGKRQLDTGLYLDGGFGVGKTHLLASLWHAYPGKKVFGSFIAYTGLIGALRFAEAVRALQKYELVCIDEFELDDPGDTMMMSRLLNELESSGVRFAATSNTPPNALGEGRFAAADFAREIHGIADRFRMIRIDGEDHRHRPTEFAAKVLSESEVSDQLIQLAKPGTYLDSFDELLRHLAKIHPSKFGRLLKGVTTLGITEVHKLTDQVQALRFVSFVDRAYEAQLKIFASGIDLVDIFDESYINGGYRKKYLRAVSRIGAMTR